MSTETTKPAAPVTAEQIADAFRLIAARMQKALDNGSRSASIDAHDLVDLFLAFADEFTGERLAEIEAPAQVAEADACPGCQTRDADALCWDDAGEIVTCEACGCTYHPEAEAAAEPIAKPPAPYWLDEIRKAAGK